MLLVHTSSKRFCGGDYVKTLAKIFSILLVVLLILNLSSLTETESINCCNEQQPKSYAVLKTSGKFIAGLVCINVIACGVSYCVIKISRYVRSRMNFDKDEWTEICKN